MGAQAFLFLALICWIQVPTYGNNPPQQTSHTHIHIYIYIQKAALCGPPFCMFLFSLDFLFFSLQKIKYQECLGQELFLEVLFVWLLLLGVHLFSCGHWFRKLLSAIKTTKIPKTSKKNQKKQKNQSILRNVWAKDFLWRHCFFWFFWFSSSFFWFLVPEAFTGY